MVTEKINGVANQTLYGPGTDHPLARNGEYFLPNHASSTTGLTDGSGNLTQSYLYGPFGELLNAPTDSNPFQYTGRENDGDGLLYYRARYYCPAWGRFLSSDPAGFGGGINPFVYAGNNPVNNADPSGMLDDPNTNSFTAGPGTSEWAFKHPNQDGINAGGWSDAYNEGGPPAAGVGGGDPSPATALAANAIEIWNRLVTTLQGWVLGGQSKTPTDVVITGPVQPATPSQTGGFTLTIGMGIDEGQPYFNCFVAGTPVAMADGSTKPIEDVQPGDVVVSRNPQTGETAAKRVVRTFQREREGTLVLCLAGGEAIETTEGHPFFVADRGWVSAASLTVGDPIVTRTGPPIQVAGIEHRSGTIEVYNFEVEEFHSYFVGLTGGGVWVHNTSPLPGQTTTALGHMQDTAVAAQLGYNTLNIPNWTWAANWQWLDAAIARGDTFFLATDPGRARVGSVYYHELRYMTARGFVQQGAYLVRP